MIHLILGAGLRAGPFSVIRLSRGGLESESQLDDARTLPAEVASDGTRDFRVIFKSGVTAAFEGVRGEHSPLYGPFADFGTASGIATADRRRFASFDADSGMWRHEASGQLWRVLILMEDGLMLRRQT